tara:strand:- start:429 stop:554 length:126 start_codon:yes stop_codon:yes gene_type:complete
MISIASPKGFDRLARGNAPGGKKNNKITLYATIKGKPSIRR